MYTVYEIIELSSYKMYILYFIKVFLELVLYKNFLYYKLSIKDINLSILFFFIYQVIHAKFNHLFSIKRNNFNDKFFVVPFFISYY